MQEVQGRHSGRAASRGSARWEISLAVLLLYSMFRLFGTLVPDLAHSSGIRAARNHSTTPLSSCGTIRPSVNDVTASFSRARCDHCSSRLSFCINDHLLRPFDEGIAVLYAFS